MVEHEIANGWRKQRGRRGREGEEEERESKRRGIEKGSKRVCPCVLVCACACLLLAAGHKTVAYFAAVNEKYVSAAKRKFGQHDYDIM